MKNVDLSWKKILLTIFLVLLTATIVYGWIGVYITGPIVKDNLKEEEIIQNIRYANSDICNTITRNSFKFVTYTCETSKEYVVYDKKAEKIASREKSKARLDEVEDLLDNYPSLIGMEINVAYAYETMAYVVEEGTNVLVVDFDILDVLFYSGGE